MGEDPPPLGTLGRFDLLRRIGVGGMGEVFLSRVRSGDRAGDLVAVKRLLPQCASDPVFIGMFLDEARLTTRLVHPNICRVFEQGQHGSHYFLAMEWIDGVSLKELLHAMRRAQAPLPIPVVAHMIAQVAAGLDFAHRLQDEIGVHVGVVHRDVSPGNIMISRRGEVKIVDFGLAKARTQLHRTMPGIVKGKFGYMAPEQLGGQIDWRTDIFALGLCLYEALTGRLLFGQDTAAATVMAVRAYTVPSSVRDLRPDVPPSLDAVVRRALARDKVERFQSAAEMKMIIERVLAHHQSVVTPERLGAIVERYFAGQARPSAPPSLNVGVAPLIGADTVNEVAAMRKRSPVLYWVLGAIGVAAIAALVAAAVLSS